MSDARRAMRGNENPHNRPQRYKASKPSEKTSEGSGVFGIGRTRVLVVLGAFTVASCILSFRAMHMNVLDGTSFEAFAAEQISDVQPEVQRGDILSSDGRKLATSVQVVRIAATPYQVEEPERAAEEIEDAISSESDLDADELSARLSGDGELDGYSVVATVSPETAERVLDLGLPGVYLEPSKDRVYPDGNLASQVIGNQNAYGETFGGIESQFDDELASGRDVTLTIDAAVQRELQDALSEATDEYKADNAVGLVMRVDDGSIVAMASSPTFDNNEYSEADPDRQRNRAITDPYEPGSTLKPFTFAAALEEGSVDEASYFTVPDSMQVSDRIIHDSIAHETEIMDLGTILSESSNVGTIQVAQALGERELHDYLSAFGFGEPTGLDLGGESSGLLPDRSQWSGVSIGNIPIGQGLTVTPVQLASAYATIANGGVSITPHVVSSQNASDPRERVISEQTSDIVTRMLRGTVQDGTGHLAGVDGYSVAGKTGTSQKVDPETMSYSEDDYYASFVGFAPASDPEYVTLIVVDTPRTSIWGESVAAPAFGRVMKFTLSYFNVTPDMPASGETLGATE